VLKYFSAPDCAIFSGPQYCGIADLQTRMAAVHFKLIESVLTNKTGTLKLQKSHKQFLRCTVNAACKRERERKYGGRGEKKVKI
jgi:hypothetical protein